MGKAAKRRKGKKPVEVTDYFRPTPEREAAIALFKALDELERYLRDTPHHNAVQAAAARRELNKWGELFGRSAEQGVTDAG